MWSQRIVPRVIARPTSPPAADGRVGDQTRLGSPGLAVLEARVERRWQRAKTGDPETAGALTRPDCGRRLVHVDGWLTEEWLARHAASRPHEPGARISDATAVDPHMSAADLLALRTRLVATGTAAG